MTPYENALRILVQHGISQARGKLALNTGEIKGQDISGHPYFDLTDLYRFIKKETK